MTPVQVTRPEDARLARWVEENVGGRVVRVERLARWRPAWDVDVEVDGLVLPLHARGDREPNFAIACRIADEAGIHDLLESHGLPVPHAYGLCADPYVLVMDRLAGSVDLTFARTDEERGQIVDEYLALLPTIYSIPLEEAARAGFAIPSGPEDVALGSFRRLEAVYDAQMPTPDPVAEFLRRWLHRNYPRHRMDAAFITHDAFQFMFQDGRITGLIDFELACIGDPMMDLGALRVRETIKNLGDLPSIAQRFEAVTGIPVDYDVVDYHAVLYNALTVLSAGPPIAEPMRTTDFVSHMAWYVNSARWAFEVIADMEGFPLEPVDEPGPQPSRHAAGFAHLADALRARAAETPADYEAASLQRVARHLRRVDEIGAALLDDDLDDLATFLGRRVEAGRADRELLDAIDRAGPDRDPDLVRLLDRRMQRAHLLLGPTSSLLLRHPRLRDVRPGSDTTPDDDDRWPAGAIPGTH